MVDLEKLPKPEAIAYIPIISNESSLLTRQLVNEAGYENPEFVSENLNSHRSINRPLLLSAIERAGKIRRPIVVRNLNHLSPSGTHLLYVIGRLIRNNTELISIEDGFGVTNDRKSREWHIFRLLTLFTEQNSDEALSRAVRSQKGRPRLLNDEQVNSLRSAFKSGRDKNEIAAEYKISRATMYRLCSRAKTT